MNEAPRTVLWIASYPKSGNTWLRFLACNLVYGRQDSAAALAQLVPDLHEMGEAPQPPSQGRMIKTHFPYCAGLPLLRNTAAAIYVVRNPADVMASNYHYAVRSGALPDTTAESWGRYVDEFIANRGDPRWIRFGMGTWEENVRSWVRLDLPFPALRLRYEDMLADPAGAARAVSRLIKPDASEAEIQEAVAHSSFERMRAIEEADIRAKRAGIFFKPYLQRQIDSGLRFMRSGRSGDATASVSADQRARFVDAFGSLMRDLGYEERIAGQDARGVSH